MNNRWPCRGVPGWPGAAHCVELCCLLLVAALRCEAQNLVPNPGFEEVDSCPQWPLVLNYSPGARPTHWYTCSESPEYFNACVDTMAGVPSNLVAYQPAFEGQAYSGLYTYVSNGEVREMIGVELTSPLDSGEIYYVSFRANAAFGGEIHWPTRANNNMGVLFTMHADEWLFEMCIRDRLFTLDPKTGAVRQLTHFNRDLVSQLDLGKVESYWIDGAAGDKVQGWVILPPGFDATKTYPMVQLMHGGPHTMVRDSWNYRWNPHVFAATGCVVTWVNRHGSTGFGQKFAQSILNEWGVKPLDDILRATDVLLARFPNIDAKRIAAAGASYGGYMAAWAEGHTDRFACIINHAGVNDFITQYGADVTTYGFSKVLGGTPWDNPEGMRKNDPMTYAKDFKTPMLILHGELDYRVPYVNGTALYGCLLYTSRCV